MIKINVSFSKKVPGAAEYSSDGFMCALEMEASDSVLNSPAELRQKMAWLWGEAKRSVDEQIANGNGQKPAPILSPAPAPASAPAPQNGQAPASSKQIKFILALGQRDHSMSLADLKAFLEKTVGNGDVHHLTKEQAHAAIETLSKGAKP